MGDMQMTNRGGIDLHTTWISFLNSNIQISQASLSPHVTLAEVLYIIRCTNRSSNDGARWRTNTFCSVVHHSAANIVWSIATFSLTKICKKKKIAKIKAG